MLFYGKTDVGHRRAANQDNFIIRKYSADVLLAVVCDGMGGANGGSTASTVAANTFYEVISGHETLHPSFFGLREEEILHILSEAAAEANRAVYEMSIHDPALEGMGTTLVGCIISGEHVYIVNVGDSRLYHISKESYQQITKDHSYVQHLVDLGKISPEEAKNSRNKNLITRAVGTEKFVECDLFTCDVKVGDFLVLCSDGLTNHVEPSEIYETVCHGTSYTDIQMSCESLIDQANDRGGLDNITAVVLSV